MSPSNVKQGSLSCNQRGTCAAPALVLASSAVLPGLLRRRVPRIGSGVSVLDEDIEARIR